MSEWGAAAEKDLVQLVFLFFFFFILTDQFGAGEMRKWNPVYNQAIP